MKSFSKGKIESGQENNRPEGFQPSLGQVMPVVTDFLDLSELGQSQPLKCISNLIGNHLPLPFTLAEKQYIQSLVQAEQKAFDEVVFNEAFTNGVADLLNQDVTMLSQVAIQQGVSSGFDKWTRFANGLDQFSRYIFLVHSKVSRYNFSVTLFSVLIKRIKWIYLAPT